MLDRKGAMLPGDSGGEKVMAHLMAPKTGKTERNHLYATNMDSLGQSRKRQPWWGAVLITLIPKQ